MTNIKGERRQVPASEFVFSFTLRLLFIVTVVLNIPLGIGLVIGTYIFIGMLGGRGYLSDSLLIRTVAYGVWLPWALVFVWTLKKHVEGKMVVSSKILKDEYMKIGILEKDKRTEDIIVSCLLFLAVFVGVEGVILEKVHFLIPMANAGFLCWSRFACSPSWMYAGGPGEKYLGSLNFGFFVLVVVMLLAFASNIVLLEVCSLLVSVILFCWNLYRLRNRTPKERHFDSVFWLTIGAVPKAVRRGLFEC